MSYTAGAIDPVNRLRFAAPDIGSTEIRDSADYTRALRTSLSEEHLFIYLPTSAGFASASVQVAMSGSSLVLLLTRAASTTSITLAEPGSSLATIVDLVDAIRALNQGWVCGLEFGRTGHLIQMTDDSWPLAIRSELLTAIAYQGRPGDLAVMSAAVSCLDTDPPVRPARLRFYYLATALRKVLGSIAADRDRPVEKVDGDMTRRWEEASKRLPGVAAQEAFGIYQEAVA